MTVTDISSTLFTFRYPVPPRPSQHNQVDHPCPLNLPKEELVDQFDSLRISNKPLNVSRKRRADVSSPIAAAAALPPIKKTTKRQFIKKKPNPTPKFFSAISFPSEILETIMMYSDRQTRGRLMSVSQELYGITAPSLYEKVTITKRNASDLFRGITRSAPTYIKRKSQPAWTSHMVIHQAIQAIPHPHQPAVLLWPDVPLDSEEEDEDNIHQVNLVELSSKDSQTSNKLGISLSSHSDTKEPKKRYIFYPTIESHHRKKILLSRIRTLVISSTFSKALCQDINLWSRRTGLSPRLTPSKTLLPKLEKLTISDEVVKQMMDYRDRHLGQPHPILDFLKTAGKPKHLCINLPVFTIDDRQNYISSRTLLDKIYLDGITWKEKIYEVSTKFRSFASTRKYEELRHILKCFNTSDIDTLTIHNFGNGDLPTTFTNTRIFTYKCQCYEKPTPELGCFDHITQGTRMRQLTKLAAAITPLRPSVNEARRVAIITGSFSHTKVGWFRILKSKIPKLEADKLKLSGWQEAEACQCCGTKEGVKGDSALALRRL